MKRLTLVIMALVMTGCSSIPKTKWTDKNMRVMIDPDSIDEENYVQIQHSLVKSNKFTVVDRTRGMAALKKEQERLHKTEEDRYADKDKWAHWGKMYGVGTIIVAHTQCQRNHDMFNRTKIYLECRQFLSMVDSNTGEIFLAVDGSNSGPSSYDLSHMAPDWDEVVASMVESYPKEFRNENYAKTITDYQDVSKENAIRNRTPAVKE